MEQKVMQTAIELYNTIQKRGLEIRTYDGRDNGLFRELKTLLGCPDEKFAEYLRTSQLTAQEFLVAFLKVAQPFSEMFRDIWVFLSKHFAPKAGETISIRFGEPGAEVLVELEHFRRMVERTKIIEEIVSSWPEEILYKLHKLAEILIGDKENLPGLQFFSLGEPLFLTKPAISDSPIDEIVEEIWRFYQRIVDESHFKKQSDFVSYQKDSVALKLTDLMPKWSQVFANLPFLDESDKGKAFLFFSNEIKPFIEKKREVNAHKIKEALDILDLPFWKERWHTYEIWSTIFTLKSLKEFKPRLRIIDGRVLLDNSSRAIVAYLPACSFPNATVVIQEKTPVNINGKAGGMMPDLRICFSTAVNDPDNTAATVEFKQRKEISRGHVEEVAQRYTYGAPKSGGTVIINYDNPAIIPVLPEKAFYIEGLRPGNFQGMSDFKARLMGLLADVGFKTIPLNILLMDVSQSMEGAYQDKKFVNLFLTYKADGQFHTYFFNDSLVENMKVDEAGLPQEIGGRTDLRTSMQQLINKVGKINRLLIISDFGYKRPDDLLVDIEYKECKPDNFHPDMSWLTSSKTQNQLF